MKVGHSSKIAVRKDTQKPPSPSETTFLDRRLSFMRDLPIRALRLIKRATLKSHQLILNNSTNAMPPSHLGGNAVFLHGASEIHLCFFTLLTLVLGQSCFRAAQVPRAVHLTS